MSAWLSTGFAPKFGRVPSVYVASCCDRAPPLPSTRPHIAVTVRVGTTISRRVTHSLVASSSRGMGCARHCSPEVFFLPGFLACTPPRLSSRSVVGTVLVVSQHFSTMSRVADRPVCVTGGAICTGWTPLHVNVPRAEHGRLHVDVHGDDPSVSSRCYPRHHPCYRSFCCCVFRAAAPPASASSSSVVRKFLYDATLVSVSARSLLHFSGEFRACGGFVLDLTGAIGASCCPLTVADVVLRSFVLYRHFGFL